MQVLLHVICTRGQSLREAISRNGKLQNHNFTVSEHKRHGRSKGWAKVHSTLPDRHGAINLEWDADTGVLVSRVITRRRGRPNLIVGDFVDFLLSNFPRRITAINIILPRS